MSPSSRASLRFFAVAGLLLGAAPREAAAFCRTTTAPVPPSYDAARRGCITTGLPLFWKGACVTYSLQQEGLSGTSFEDISRVIGQSFATWTEASCGSGRVGVSVFDIGAVACSEVRYNTNAPNQNVIVFRQDTWPYSDASNTLGLTTITFNADTGEIYDADMEINATSPLSLAEDVPSQGYDLLSIVTHEAGHFLGLAHAVDSDATMFAAYKPGTSSLRSLTSDDVSGLCTIYPDEGTRSVDVSVAANGILASSTCSKTPRHGFSTECFAEEDEGGCSVSPGREASGARASLLGVASVMGLGALGARLRRARARGRVGAKR